MSTLALRNPFRGFVSLLYPATCEACRAPITPHETLCRSCLDAVTRIASPFCAKCSQPFAGAISDTFTCANCEGRALHFDLAVSLYRSRGVNETRL